LEDSDQSQGVSAWVDGDPLLDRRGGELVETGLTSSATNKTAKVRQVCQPCLHVGFCGFQLWRTSFSQVSAR
jgi:hypothetical protein